MRMPHLRIDGSCCRDNVQLQPWRCRAVGDVFSDARKQSCDERSIASIIRSTIFREDADVVQETPEAGRGCWG